MSSQWTTDWDLRFRQGDTPWEEEAPSDVMIDLFGRLVSKAARVLDVGCGLGTNAIWLGRNGYRVAATDVSVEAIRRAGERARLVGAPVEFAVADFLTGELPSIHYDCVFDRGCFHSFTTSSARLAFARRVAGVLVAGGLWLNISGSADNPDPPGEVARHGYPRLSLVDIATAVEPFFQVVEIRRCLYGATDAARFLAFACVLKKR